MTEEATVSGDKVKNNGSDFEETCAASTVALLKEMDESMKDAFKSAGAKGLKKWLDTNLNKWKNIPLNIAIAGESGAGKSTLINVLRGLQDDDPKSAPVGVTETTTERMAYKMPINEKLVYWDLPGLGTDTFGKAQYLEKVRYSEYDYFIIVFCNRLTENSLWLAKEVRKQNKMFMFIRTKVGDDVKNNKRQRKGELETLKALRYDIEKHLEMYFEEKVDIFLIDSHMHTKFDFGHFQKTLIDNIPEHKREAMILSLTSQTKQVIIEKSERLKKRIWVLRAVSEIAAGVPLPGLEAIVDVAVLTNEVWLYQEQFGLDENTMKETAEMLGMSVKEIEEKLDLKGWLVSASSDAVSIAVPVVGGILAAGASFGLTLSTLRTALERMREGALKNNTEFEKLLK